MNNSHAPLSETLPRDLTSGLVVFLVTLPLCLGVAQLANAPLFSGILAGIVGGILVGMLSGSHVSVSGPAAGLTAVIAAQIVGLGSFPAFLTAVVLAGVIQIVLGLARAGFLAAFFPSGVIKGLLAAVGIILIFKQIPHILGHDADPEGDMAFVQPDKKNTFTEIIDVFQGEFQLGAAAIGLLSLALLVVWDRWRWLKASPLPAPLVVVVLGVGLNLLFRRLGDPWAIEPSHLIQVPAADGPAGLRQFLQWPDFSALSNRAVYAAAVTIAAVASLETLLNLEAADKIDPRQRVSPPSRELFAQGVGNVASGLVGGLPVTSVIVYGSVNILAGGRTKLSAVVYGGVLLAGVAFLAPALNAIPLSCLAAVLLVTGVKLTSPALVRQMWAGGRYQFIPFAATVAAIVLTDLLVGVLIGLAISVGFILSSNVRRPVRKIVEKHLGGEVVHVVLANQVSFLNRATLTRVLDEVPRGGHVLLDASNTDYIDPDVLGLIRDFKDETGPARGVEVSLVGFRQKYQLGDQTQYVDYSTRELQAAITPRQVLDVLKNGHERFRSGERLTRDLGRVVQATAAGQHPLAVVLSCIDSRAPAELIFDVGVGDIFSVRLAGNITSRKGLGSIEYACAVAGAKLILVMGHTRCGAVTASVDLMGVADRAAEITGCQHIGHVIDDIQLSVDPAAAARVGQMSPGEKEKFVNEVARRNVAHAVDFVIAESRTIQNLVRDGRLAVIGAMYDVTTGGIEYLNEPA